jgi:hypothetical protein
VIPWRFAPKFRFPGGRDANPFSHPQLLSNTRSCCCRSCCVIFVYALVLCTFVCRRCSCTARRLPWVARATGTARRPPSLRELAERAVRGPRARRPWPERASASAELSGRRRPDDVHACLLTDREGRAPDERRRSDQSAAVWEEQSVRVSHARPAARDGSRGAPRPPARARAGRPGQGGLQGRER